VSGAEEILRRHAAALEGPLKGAILRIFGAPPTLKKAIEYSLMAGGKRLRPALVMESAIACGGANEPAALAAAVAIELIHTFSLVHDDLPAMDDDDLRRGRPTNHKVFGEAMAILAGDAMVTLAFEVLADAGGVRAAQLVRELATAAGAAGMIGGQVLDIECETQSLSLNQLQQIHRMKTGALLRHACRMGAIAAHASQEQLVGIEDYGQHLGLAFQIVDDILDVTATPEQLGKRTNKDAGSGKNTYPQLIGIDASRAAAQENVRQAIAALAELGPAADGLRAIAEFVTARTF
jgi:geranylgeranyl diphosphate synthase type II